VAKIDAQGYRSGVRAGRVMACRAMWVRKVPPVSTAINSQQATVARLRPELAWVAAIPAAAWAGAVGNVRAQVTATLITTSGGASRWAFRE